MKQDAKLTVPVQSDFEETEQITETMKTKPQPEVKRESERKLETRQQEIVQTETQRPTMVMSELDSMIYERIKAQPSTLDHIDISVSRTEAPGLHRMSLPPYFEQFSYDCTRGDACDVHTVDKKTGKVISGKGKYIFRWILKVKQAVDQAMNLKGWYLVNLTYFPDAPRIHFSTSGGVENGDAILSFIFYEKALKIRKFPGEKSQEKLRSQMTPSRKKANRVLMTGNPDSDHIYEPDMGADESDVGEGSAATPGSLQEGRDF